MLSPILRHAQHWLQGAFKPLGFPLAEDSSLLFSKSIQFCGQQRCGKPCFLQTRVILKM